MLFDDLYGVSQEEEDRRKAIEMMSRIDPGNVDAFKKSLSPPSIIPGWSGDTMPVAPGVAKVQLPSLTDDVNAAMNVPTARGQAAEMIRRQMGDATAQQFLDQDVGGARTLLRGLAAPGQEDAFNRWNANGQRKAMPSDYFPLAGGNFANYGGGDGYSDPAQSMGPMRRRPANSVPAERTVLSTPAPIDPAMGSIAGDLMAGLMSGGTAGMAKQPRFTEDMIPSLAEGAANLIGSIMPSGYAKSAQQPVESLPTLPTPTTVPVSPLSRSRVVDGVTINDGFDALGNLIGTNSPSMVGVNGPGAGYTRHNGDGTVTPIPSAYDATLPGEYQVARAIEADRHDTPFLLQHGLRAQLAREQMANELDKARIMMGGKEGQNFNKALQMTGDPRIPTAQALSQIQRMVDTKEITPEQGQSMSLQRLASRIGPDGKTLVPVVDAKAKDFSGLTGVLSSGDAKGYGDDVVRKFIESSMGLNEDRVAQRLADLQVRGNNKLTSLIPFMRLRQDSTDPRILHGANMFNKANLPPELQNEFDVLSRLYPEASRYHDPMTNMMMMQRRQAMGR